MCADLTIINIIFYICLTAGLIKLYLKLTVGWDNSPTCLVGKTIIITGANAGIGFYAAQDFAKRGARVILACRDSQRAQQACAKIIAATGNENVIVRILDLASLASIREFANTIHATEQRLDILVNNAGAGGFEHTITSDGMSLSMQSNHFGPFLLTILLLDLLKRSAPSRIVMVSSVLAHLAKLNLNDLNAPFGGTFSNSIDYCNSKLLNILFSNELARKLKGSGVDINSLHPGTVHTSIFRHLPRYKRRLANMYASVFYKTPEEGVQTTIYVAVSKDIIGVSGEYFSDCRRGWMPKSGRNVKLARKVWEMSEEFVKLKEDEKKVFE